MAYVVENNVLITALEMELEKLRSNVDVLYQTKMKKFRIPSPDANGVDSPWAEITMEDGQEFLTRLLVRSSNIEFEISHHYYLFRSRMRSGRLVTFQARSNHPPCYTYLSKCRFQQSSGNQNLTFLRIMQP